MPTAHWDWSCWGWVLPTHWPESQVASGFKTFAQNFMIRNRKQNQLYLMTCMTTAITFAHSNFHIQCSQLCWLRMGKTTNERLKCPIPPRDGKDRGRSSCLSCSVLQCSRIRCNFEVYSTTEATTGTIIASKYVETICCVAPHSCVYPPRAGNGAVGAERFPLIGLKGKTYAQSFAGKNRKQNQLYLSIGPSFFLSPVKKRVT